MTYPVSTFVLSSDDNVNVNSNPPYDGDIIVPIAVIRGSDQDNRGTPSECTSNDAKE